MKACFSATTKRPSSKPSASCWMIATSGASSACRRRSFYGAGAGVKTNLLFFTKGQPTDTIWYYDLSDIKVGKKTPLTVEKFEDFFRLLPQRADSERSWTVPRAEIEAKNLRPQGRQPERQKQRRHPHAGGIARRHRSQRARGCRCPGSIAPAQVRLLPAPILNFQPTSRLGCLFLVGGNHLFSEQFDGVPPRQLAA